jgi:hypothetical protein
MTRYSNIIENYGYRKWGEKMLEKELIDFNEIDKYKGILKNNIEIVEEE